MRLSNAQAVARPAFFDRNPIPQTVAYTASGVAPHTLTTRWTYTSPAGKKTWLDVSYVRTTRSAVATAFILSNALIAYTPSGGAATAFTEAIQSANTVGNTDRTTAPQCGYIGPGDTLTAQSQDGSTGGTIDYQLTAKLTQFDA